MCLWIDNRNTYLENIQISSFHSQRKEKKRHFLTHLEQGAVVGNSAVGRGGGGDSAQRDTAHLQTVGGDEASADGTRQGRRCI